MELSECGNCSSKTLPRFIVCSVKLVNCFSFTLFCFVKVAVNLAFYQCGKEHKRGWAQNPLHAHSPTFLINCVDTFKFKPLGDYAGRKEVVSKAEPLIPRLHIYLKEKNKQ